MKRTANMLIATRELPSHIMSRVNGLLEDNVTFNEIFDILDIDSTLNSEFKKYLDTRVDKEMQSFISDLTENVTVEIKEFGYDSIDEFVESKEVINHYNQLLLEEFQVKVADFYESMEERMTEVLTKLFEKNEDLDRVLANVPSAVDRGAKSNEFQSMLEEIFENYKLSMHHSLIRIVSR